MTETFQDAARTLGRVWWAFLVFGLLAVAAGVLAVINPEMTLLAIALLFGIYLLVAGGLHLSQAIAGPSDARVMHVLVGVLALVAGLICIRRPGESLLALVLVLGIYLIVSGTLDLFNAVTTAGDRALLIALAVVDLVLGILVLALPGLSLETLALLFGFSLIVRGGLAIVQALALRRMARTPATPLRASPTGV